MSRYIIISPVRNEEEFIKTTIESVISQTVTPDEWIIVNDGSTDNTEEIIKPYTNLFPWIKLFNLDDRGFYYPGTGIMRVVQFGFDQVTSSNWDFIVKLDCDISVEKQYFEKLLKEFDRYPKLGIASGSIYFIEGEKELKENSQSDHPWGASKIYRKECFNAIGGWKAIPGWDLADLLSAQMKGWETKCFDEYKIFHFRQTGMRRTGITNGRFLWGRFQYRYGYGFTYILLKSIFWLKQPPLILGGVGIFLGYLFAAVKREEKLFDPEMRKFLRKKQRMYLKIKLNSLLKSK